MKWIIYSDMFATVKATADSTATLLLQYNVKRLSEHIQFNTKRFYRMNQVQFFFSFGLLIMFSERLVFTTSFIKLHKEL